MTRVPTDVEPIRDLSTVHYMQQCFADSCGDLQSYLDFRSFYGESGSSLGTLVSEPVLARSMILYFH